MQLPLLPKATLQAFSETHFIGCIKGGEAVFTFKPDGLERSSYRLSPPRIRILCPRENSCRPDGRQRL